MKPFWFNVKTMPDVRKVFAKISAILRIAPTNNLTATSAPTATDDRGKGYSVGSYWKDTTTGIVSIMTRDDDSNATWLTQPRATQQSSFCFLALAAPVAY